MAVAVALHRWCCGVREGVVVLWCWRIGATYNSPTSGFRTPLVVNQDEFSMRCILLCISMCLCHAKCTGGFILLWESETESARSM